MFIAHHDRIDDEATLTEFMRQHPFAVLVTAIAGTPHVTHLPLVVAESASGLRVSGHVARANPHWRWFGDGTTVAIFHGVHAYISPAAYDSYRSVPTWNYVAVHASGHVAVINDPATRLARVEELIAVTDPAYQQQWDALPSTYRDAMLGGIVAFDLTVERLEGNYKLSGNKTSAEQARIANVLINTDDSSAQATGRLMIRRNSETKFPSNSIE